ncbi:DUF2589 domain-containing protein [Tumebacillus sp. ITR2]|jgi:hypothetical protein|uniref:DUF2589 domain-containing protein n=1 Tax=Tumebacillus amylolyticus TaxID=2801339 RepID=A0ABS1JGU5_9BACL|nr:DUF2589 domain-containing protein [Tumebacillus amylolyticus]MBL0389507.1 DUF2589 domain-containing protein [Tumebacillus amylolyticus]
MSDLVNMSEQFKGLPMQDLIGAPIKAACDAQIGLARATADFIQTVGIEKDKDGKPTGPRHVKFEYNRMVENPAYNPADPSSKPFVDQQVEISVPLLAIVPIPNLGIDLVDVTFDMEVKSSFQSKDKFEYEVGGSVSGSFWGVSVEVHGSVTSSTENTRQSDNSARYHVQVHAKDKGTPEGLARVLDMLHQSITPVAKELTTTTK